MSNTADTPAQTKKPQRFKRHGGVVIILLIAAMIFFSREPVVDTVNCTPEIMATRPDVVMLGAWWCSYCYRAKKYLQANNIHYCVYDMENTAEGRRLYEKHGGGAIPILLIGQYRLNGFSEYQIEQALQLSKQEASITEP